MFVGINQTMKLAGLCALALLCALPARAQSTSVLQAALSDTELPPWIAPQDDSAASTTSPSQQEYANAEAQRQDGSISGKVVDQSGASIPGAVVKLVRPGLIPAPESTTDEDGRFAFTHIEPGPFELSITSTGLTAQTFSGTLSTGEAYLTPLIELNVAAQVTQVQVTLTQEQLADVQITQQEQQRVFGFIPNFYVSYEANAAPLSARHKFGLAWRTMRDPITFVAVGAVAGMNQAGDRWGAYGQGAEGYAKRFGATYADVFTGTFLGGAVLPTVFKQDPRYFYKGTGSKKSRLLYALANAVICKGDNGNWQPNYSSILGNLAAGGISNLYYPARDRNGADVVVGTALIRLGETALANVFQELVLPRFTSRGK